MLVYALLHHNKLSHSASASPNRECNSTAHASVCIAFIVLHESHYI